MIDLGMDIVKGDRLALLPTAYDNMASDDVLVESYDNETGKAVLDRELLFYHWGAK